MISALGVLRDLGCWEDDVWDPAVPEIDDVLLPPHLVTEDNTKNCANKAKLLGYSIIAIRGGFCGSSTNADVQYARYGESFNCNSNGTGADNSIQVYELDVIMDGGLVIYLSI